MAQILFPFTCNELNVNNTFYVNSTMFSFQAKGTAAPVFVNTTATVVNSASGRTLLTALNARVSNGTTFSINLTSSGILLTHPSISGSMSYSEANSVDGAKEYAITVGRFEITNTLGFGFSANLTDMWVGTDGATPNVAKLTATKLSLKDANTFISTTGLSINNQTVMNVTHLTVGTVLANLVTLEAGSTGNASNLSLFSTTANGVAPGTNTKIGSLYVLHANGNWYPPGLIHVSTGNLQGTPGSPNVKVVEITWANTYGDIFIDGWIIPQTNAQNLRAYFFFEGAWQNSGGDYDTTRWEMRPTGGMVPSGDNDLDYIPVIDALPNVTTKACYFKLQLHEVRSTNEGWMKFDASVANSTTNNVPYFADGWGCHRDGTSMGANGVTGIRLYFPTGNVASAAWTVRALHRRQ